MDDGNRNEIFYTKSYRRSPGENILEFSIFKLDLINNKESCFDKNAGIEDISNNGEQIIFWKSIKDETNNFDYNGLYFNNYGQISQIREGPIDIGTTKRLDLSAKISPDNEKIFYCNGLGDIYVFEYGNETHSFSGRAPAFNYDGSKLAFFIKQEKDLILRIYNFETESFEDDITVLKIQNPNPTEFYILCSAW
ncbi:hypothetical protein ACFL4T_08650 [candidate division KSB1 bacterium]